MENTINPGRRVKNSTLYKTQIGIIILVALIFAILFLTNTKPLVDVDIPIGPPGQPTFSHFIYGGFGENQLWKPMAVTTIGDRVFVSDNNNYRIQSFTKDGTSLNIFGERGDGAGQFQFPYGLAEDAEGRLMVADLYTAKISVFDVDGNFIEYFGEKGDIGILGGPTDITFVDNKLYVADVDKNRVFVFDNKGKLLLEIGKEFDELYAPNGVAVDKKTGEITVVDTGGNRAIVYDKNGQILGHFNGSPNADGAAVWSTPRGIAFDSNGTLYIVSQLSNLIYGYDQEYQQLFTFGGMGSGEGQFSLPNGIHIDEENNIYITDTTNNRVAVFR